MDEFVKKCKDPREKEREQQQQAYYIALTETIRKYVMENLKDEIFTQSKQINTMQNDLKEFIQANNKVVIMIDTQQHD